MAEEVDITVEFAGLKPTKCWLATDAVVNRGVDKKRRNLKKTTM
jgi:hypothetical protein